MNFEYKYILNEKDEPVTESDTLKWAKWLEEANRTVAKEKVNDKTVSTVFLGIDNNYGEAEPLLWETAIFDKNGAVDTFRCGGLRQDALEMHRRAIQDLLEPNTEKIEELK